MITWAVSDGREEGGDRVVPAASTIKLFVASAFWRSGLDPAEPVEAPAVPWSVAEVLSPIVCGGVRNDQVGQLAPFGAAWPLCLKKGQGPACAPGP